VPERRLVVTGVPRRIERSTIAAVLQRVVDGELWRVLIAPPSAPASRRCCSTRLAVARDAGHARST
jgi:hypothetical protein